MVDSKTIADRGPWWALLVHGVLAEVRPIVEDAMRGARYQADELLYIEGHRGWCACYVLRNERADRTIADDIRGRYVHVRGVHDRFHDTDYLFARGSEFENLTEQCSDHGAVRLVEWNHDGQLAAWFHDGCIWRDDSILSASTYVESFGVLVPWWSYPHPYIERPHREAALFEGIAASDLEKLEIPTSIMLTTTIHTTTRGVVVVGPGASWVARRGIGPRASRKFEVSYYFDDGSFLCSLSYADGPVGWFVHPERTYGSYLPDIEGETDPRAIVTKLGIPIDELFAPPPAALPPAMPPRPERGGDRRWPSWVLLVPGNRDDCIDELARLSRAQPRDTREETYEQLGFEIVDGHAGYVSIFELEEYGGGSPPSWAAELTGDENHPVYELMFLDEDELTPSAYARIGPNSADITASPSDLAAHCGCWYPGMAADADPSCDVTPHFSPEAEPGERKLLGWSAEGKTARQWEHTMTYTHEWSILTDAFDEHCAAKLLDVLDDPDARNRRVACRLLDVLSTAQLGCHAETAHARLSALASGDPDESVRAAARDVIRDLGPAIARDARRKQFPWIEEVYTEHAPRVLEALSDSWTPIRMAAYRWWIVIDRVPRDIALAAQTRLAACRESETDPLRNELARYAYLNVVRRCS